MSPSSLHLALQRVEAMKAEPPSPVGRDAYRELLMLRARVCQILRPHEDEEAEDTYVDLPSPVKW